MPRKSNYRMVAEAGLARKLWIVSGSHHFRRGVLTAMIVAVAELKGQSPAAPISSPPVHSISPQIRQAVTEKLPKYTPPPPKAPEPPPEETSDSPDILRLPKVTVRAAPPTTFPPNFATLTPKQRLDLALKANPGLRVGNFFGMNNGIAMAMQREQRDVEKKASLTETVKRTKTDDSPESRKIDRLLKSATQRPNAEWLNGR
jgi:hypothetical protein